MSKYDKYLNTLFDGNYEIKKIIGVGGMAVVFEAYDVKNDRIVALKMLREEYEDNKEYVSRFVNEAKTLSMLNHPNIVKVYKINTRNKPRYMVQQRIQGVTLKKYMEKRGKSSLGFTISIAKQTLDALSHANESGIIHRDIKPQNIILLKDGSVVLTDFGIASRKGIEDIDENNAIGTAGYISPEQARGEKVDKRSDFYSLGVVMYEMVTGQLPFDGGSADEIAGKQIYQQPTPPHEYVPTVPTGLEQIILRAMEKERSKRFSSAEEMKKYLCVLETDPFADFTFVSVKDIINRSDSQVKKHLKVKNKKDEDQIVIPAKEDSYSITPSILGIFSAFACVVIIAGVYILTTLFPDSILNVFDVTKVEDVVINDYIYSMYNDQLYYELIEDGYDVEIEYEITKIYPENMIISQTPAAGRTLKATSLSITLTVAAPAPMLRLADYTLADSRVVKSELEKMGYKVTIEYMQNKTIDIGSVISTSPSHGSYLEYGSGVTLYVSTGSTYQMITVPDYRGMSESELIPIVELLYRLDGISYEYSDSIPQGCVISQSIPKGMYTARGSFISFVISAGVDPDKVVIPTPTPTPEITPEVVPTPEDLPLFVPSD